MKKRKACSLLLVLAVMIGLMTAALPSAGVLAEETATISMDSTTIQEGENFSISCANTAAKDWICIYPKDFTDKYKYYDYLYANTAGVAFPSGQTSRYGYGSSSWPLAAGEYVAVLYANDGYNEIMRLPFEVKANTSKKTAVMDKESYAQGDIITVTTSNWVADDHDFIRIYKKPVTSYTAGYVGNTYGTWGQSTYTFNTTDWEIGEYELIAFDKGDWNTHIAKVNFTLTEKSEEPPTPVDPSAKSATMEKTAFYKNETIVVTTKNWIASDHDFIRIYKTPVTNYNAGFVAQTYNNWGKSTYTFFPTEWETGTYRMIAFDKGSFSTKFIADITFTVENPPAPPENEYYTNDGTTITFLQDYEVDLSAVDHSEPDGKLFIGWVDAAGNGVESKKTFTQGTVLTAKYIDYNAEGQVDFAIVKTEIRTNLELGLRFIVEKSQALSEALPHISAYGAVVLPSEIPNGDGWADLTCGGSYTYNGKTYEAAVVKGLKTFETLEDRIRYTLCMTGLTAEKFTRQYIVKGYIQYTDLFGIEKVFYADYASANPYAIAKADLEATGLSSVARKVLENIVNTVEKAHNETYEDQQKINVVGTSDDPNRWIYRLGTNGLFVREATFDSGKGGDPIAIVQLSDLHYNYINDRDRQDNNPTVLSTATERLWGANGAHVAQSKTAIDYARTADQVVITGDVLDYLSWGCIELMQKEVWDVLPNAMITIGNHDYVQQMQGTVPETLAPADRWTWLQSVWKHDIYYSSKVMGDKVMLIQMNNGERKFYESQIEPLKKDIETARENGYIVLLFMHETIYTKNRNETAVNALRVNDSGWAFNEDFCSNTANHHVGGADMDSATKEVYNLITNNADVVKGIFNGHIHSDFYTEVKAKTASGEDTIIPQYTMTGTIYDTGHVMKITVK